MSASTKVFISYSTKDTDMSNNICSALEKAGFDCWIAPRDIKPGEDWAEAIIDGIDSADYMVCVLTESANESVQVKREIERAVSKKISIIPFKVGGFELSKSMQYFLSSHHWLNVDENSVDDSIQLLIEKLTGKKSTPQPKPLKPSKPITPEPKKEEVAEKPAKKKSIAPVIGVIIALILAFSVFYFFNQGSEGGETTENKEIIPSNTLEEKLEPAKPVTKENETPKNVNSEDVAVSTLALPKTINDGFKMITRSEFSLDDRTVISNHVLGMFSSEDAEVNLMIGDMLDENLTIKSFLDRLVTLNEVNVEVLSATKNNAGKIDKIFLETDY